MPDRASVYRDPEGTWRWKRKAANGEVVASSTEGYTHRLDAVDNYYRVSGEDAPQLAFPDSED